MYWAFELIVVLLQWCSQQDRLRNMETSRQIESSLSIKAVVPWREILITVPSKVAKPKSLA